ncbi:type II toxin-antitoxin system RelE/ParE family toxin [Pseudomonas fakonensis]|uniref:Type II toxin-antitoxin system RelE/ParE family toxin n=1 Tax=Pseudomonas fakonensis TaxID=2842355 RepID=A0ABX8N4V9_9PSED|nr:type II toxin-antitoxin system RelE/ParE family toxin [Pseudomonas fakonensis]QXH50427.1 type II toxin-antitoxin system RelE/ParE family toxin [Pseudomonas fakonensis]
MNSSPRPNATASYNLEFDPRAQKEFRKLEPQLRLQFAKKLKERLVRPKVEKDKLTSMANCYKIKLKSAGYRLVYEVIDHRVVVLVVAVGKREGCAVYEVARTRLS